MLELLTSFLAGFLIPLIKGLVADWRRDQDLKRLGAAEAIAAENARALEAQRKAAAVVAEHRTVDDTARRLLDGKF